MAAHGTGACADRRLLFRQLFEKESSTYTYLLADIGDPEKPAVVSSTSSPGLYVRGNFGWFDLNVKWGSV
jgi:hypothetical protein